MQIVDASYEILDIPHIFPEPMKHIERIGRICYKSEDKIGADTDKKFIGVLYRNKHHAMLEHFRFIVEVSELIYYYIKDRNPKHLVLTNDGRFLISGSARGFIDLMDEEKTINTNLYESVYRIVHSIVEHYECPELFGMITIPNACNVIKVISDFTDLNEYEYRKHAWISVKFICDRGFTHELVRQRLASFAQESTRYCNYGKSGCTFIRPVFWDEDNIIAQRKMATWKTICMTIDAAYISMIEDGSTPQEARTILSNSIKTEIVITTTIDHWLHIFNLRALGTTGKPHPQMLELMLPLYKEFIDKGIINKVM